MQKIRKILRAVSEKTVLPTNQPINYNQQYRSYRTSLTPVQKTIPQIGTFTMNYAKRFFINFYIVLLYFVSRLHQYKVVYK